MNEPRARKIVVEAIIPAPVEVVWERSQDPDLHTKWDIRFNHICYLDQTDHRGYRLMDYRTNIAFGMTIQGWGRYLTNSVHSHSSFEFDSDDWKSLIRNGRGIWLYRPCAEGTLFKTVYDYDVRHGWIGKALDFLIFRSLLQLATEWGFETLRQWCAGDESAPKRRRGRLRFLAFCSKRWRARGLQAKASLRIGGNSRSASMVAINCSATCSARRRRASSLFTSVNQSAIHFCVE